MKLGIATITCLLVRLHYLSCVSSFVSPDIRLEKKIYPLMSSTSTSASVRLFMEANSVTGAAVDEIKGKIQEAIQPTRRGLIASESQKIEIEDLLQELESQCMLEPARSPFMAGNWFVEYTTAPPPSNGKLGPFIGEARQVIDLDNNKYVNKLKVNPGSWLTADLVAQWEEWDGIFLEDGKQPNEEEFQNLNEEKISDKGIERKEDIGLFASISNIFKNNSNTAAEVSPKKEDFGASSWKVIFKRLEIKVFGNTIVCKDFEDTARIWKMSYVDSETRIVRAGRTGKAEDDMVFYMTRDI